MANINWDIYQAGKAYVNMGCLISRCHPTEIGQFGFVTVRKILTLDQLNTRARGPPFFSI